MTDEPLLSPPDELSEPVAAAPVPARQSHAPWFYGLGFLILGAAIFYLWQYPSMPSETAYGSSARQAVQRQLADIDGRLTRLESRPATDLSKITARVDALDGRIVDQTQLASRLDTLSGRIESLSGRNQTSLDAARQHLDALTNRVAAIEAGAANLVAVTSRLDRVVRLQEASFALAFGRPIGDLPNAPAALARYAHAAPPTEAQLRLRFPRYEQAALSAKQSNNGGAPFVDRVWERAQGLITIRRGDDVVVGNPSAVALNRARVALDAGDLAGAINAIDTLKGAPSRAMSGWETDAKALLSARSALADMADQT